MLAHYGIDTLDPGCSLRRVGVLVERLPPGSWPDPDEAMSWTVEAHLAASLIDAVSMQTFEVVRTLGGKPKQPKPFYRPHPGKSRVRQQPPTVAEKETTKTNGWADFANALLGMGPQGGVTVVEVD